MDPWPERVGRDGGGLEGRSWDKCGAGGTRGKEGKTKKCEKYRMKVSWWQRRPWMSQTEVGMDDAVLGRSREVQASKKG
jgi:hypothetical protein